MDCLDIYINNSHPRSRSCSSSNEGFISLIDSINCWITNGQVDTGSTDMTITDNGDGTSTIFVDGSAFATVITTATDVQLTDNGNGTSNLVVNGTNLGSVVTVSVSNTSDLVNDGANGTDPFITANDLEQYTLSPISGTNTIDLLKDGVSVSQIDLTPYLDDTNLARLVSGVFNPTTNVLTVTRDDNTTFDIDLTGLDFTLDDAVANSTTPTGVIFNGTGQKVATFNGDIDVTGTIDPDGILYSTLADIPTAQAHFTAKGYDFTKITWINATDGHLYRGAIDVELQSVGSVNGQTGAVVLDAGDISVTPTGNLTSTHTQGALNELQTDIDALSTSAHADDDVETVSGTAVDNTDPRNPVINLQDASDTAYDNTTSGLTATDVQSAIDQIDSNVDTNTLLAHDPVTVTDGATIDLTVTGQDLTAEISGVATATAGQVFEANGLGGGTWVTPVETITSLIDNTDGTFTYTNENGTPTAFDLEQYAWMIDGNLGTDSAVHFLGTKDAQDLVIRTNNTQVGVFTVNRSLNLGVGNITPGLISFSHGNNNESNGVGSHAEGRLTQANGIYSHSQGLLTNADASYSHAEGNGSTATGDFSHAEGSVTNAVGQSSHAEGNGSTASGDFSHAEGLNTESLGQYSHSEGVYNVSASFSEHSAGLSGTIYTANDLLGYNADDRVLNYGNGSSPTNRSDAFTILKNGKTGVGFDNFETTTATEILQVNGSVTSNSYNITSDERHKSEFKPTGLTKTINGFKVDVFTYQRTYDGKRELGVKAQDVRKALNGLEEDVKNLIVPTTAGIDFNATLSAINSNYTIEAKTLTEAFELALDVVVNSDLEKNGFTSIKRKQAIKEFETLLSFETTENEDGTFTELDENQKDRLNRFKLIDWNGMKTFRTFFVTIEDLHSINTTALQWVM